MKYILTFMVLALCGSRRPDRRKSKGNSDKTVEHIKSYPAVEIVLTFTINKAEDMNTSRESIHER